MPHANEWSLASPIIKPRLPDINPVFDPTSVIFLNPCFKKLILLKLSMPIYDSKWGNHSRQSSVSG
jgi:hypothetical protein